MLVPALLALSENELVVVLVHLCDVVPKQIPIVDGCFWSRRLMRLLLILLLELIFESLGSLQWVEDRSTD